MKTFKIFLSGLLVYWIMNIGLYVMYHDQILKVVKSQGHSILGIYGVIWIIGVILGSVLRLMDLSSPAINEDDTRVSPFKQIFYNGLILAFSVALMLLVKWDPDGLLFLLEKIASVVIGLFLLGFLVLPSSFILGKTTDSGGDNSPKPKRRKVIIIVDN